jgi:hypothetical protein
MLRTAAVVNRMSGLVTITYEPVARRTPTFSPRYSKIGIRDAFGKDR